jgi:Tfp pilus assembly protein PilX
MTNASRRHTGSALLMTVFIVAMLSAVVMGMLQIHTEEIQIMQNHIRAAEALAIAEAGLNDALAQLRADSGWDAGFTDKSFVDGTYTVEIEASRITSVATSAHGFVAQVETEFSVAPEGPPYVVGIASYRVNE